MIPTCVAMHEGGAALRVAGATRAARDGTTRKTPTDSSQRGRARTVVRGERCGAGRRGAQGACPCPCAGFRCRARRTDAAHGGAGELPGIRSRPPRRDDRPDDARTSGPDRGTLPGARLAFSAAAGGTLFGFGFASRGRRWFSDLAAVCGDPIFDIDLSA